MPVLLVLAVGAVQAFAADAGSVPGEVRDYFSAPLRWDARERRRAMYVGAGVLATMSLDARLRQHFEDGSRGGTVVDVGNAWGSAGGAVAAAALWLFGRARGEERVRARGLAMLEAGVLASTATAFLKVLTGRLRPSQTGSPGRWGGGRSFPSGHATAAFAFSAAWAATAPASAGQRLLAYGLAASTAYARMRGMHHWFSDKVAGAAIGIATGRWVARRRSERLAVMPAPDGVAVVVRFP